MKRHILTKSFILSVIISMLLGISPNIAYASTNDKQEISISTEEQDSSQNISGATSSDTVDFTIQPNTSQYSERSLSDSKFAPALASIYFVPGFGEVAITITGAVVVGGITYGVGTSIYHLVKQAIKNGKAKKKDSLPSAAKNIPNRLKKSPGYVDLKKFDKRLKNGVRKEKGGYWIEPDRNKRSPHGGSKWKLYNRKGRIATLSDTGKILRG